MRAGILNAVIPTCMIALAVALVVGCGSDGPSEPPEPGPMGLDDTRLSVSEATSLGKVYLVDLPSSKAPEDFRILVDAGGEEQGSLLVESDQDGPFFRAPLHPLTPNEGGTVSIRITDSENESPAHELDVLALPAVQGAFEAVVSALRSHVEQRATWAGASIEELKGQTFDEVDPLLFPLKVAQNYVDSDEEGNLVGLVGNERGFLSEDERILLDRICGYAPFGDLIAAEVDSFQRVPVPAPKLSGSRRGLASKRACVDLGPPITNASQLSDAMFASAFADVAINPNGAPGRTLEALGVVLQGGSVLPRFGKAFSTIGAGVAAWETSADFTRSVFPNRFTDLRFDYDRPEFDEDETEPGVWSNVRVVAVSDGWTANAEVSDIVAGRLDQVLTPPQRLNVREFRALKGAAMAGFNAALQDHLDQEGGFELCAQTWDIDITGLPWSTAQVLDGKFDVNTTSLEVRPLEVGHDTLRIAAQSSEFGGREIHEDLPLQTRTIAVSVLPDEVYVETLGETIVLTGTIENAQDRTLYWDAQAGSWEDGLGIETDGGATRSLKTPVTPSFYPFLVRVESMSRDGLRVSGIPPRLHIVTVHDGTQKSIQIDPKHACIAAGETQQFEAVVTGFEEYTVHWEILEGYGSIDQNGLYTALEIGTSNAKIQATIEEAEELEDMATVDVRTCDCYLDIEITGDSNWRAGSSDVAYLVSDFGDLQYQFFFEVEDEDGALIGASITGDGESVLAPRPGQTGTWEASFSYSDGFQAWVGVWDDEIPLPGVSVVITELTEEFMEGRFVGNAFQFGEDNQITSIVGVDVAFRAGNWRLGRWPCGQE